MDFCSSESYPCRASRKVDLDGLLTDYRPTGPSRKLRPKRDFTTGKILEFEEVEKGSDGPLRKVMT